MVVDDVKALVKKYISIIGLLDQIDGGIPPPTAYITRCGITFGLYNRDKHRDPWKTLVDIELQCGTKLETKDLTVFNILNVGFWKDPSYSKIKNACVEEVFQLSESYIEDSISYEMFLACCIALNESKRNDDYLDGAMTRSYVIELIALIDKLKPLFIAKLFTEDTTRFMSCIECIQSYKIDKLDKLSSSNSLT